MIAAFICTFLGTACIARELESAYKVVADTMECVQEQHVCNAIGNAFAYKLNDPQRRTIKADRFITHFNLENKLERLEAIGEVILTDGDNIVRCDRANYQADTEVADLYDNVKITSGNNQLEGSHGIADMKKRIYKISNGKKRVQALIIDSEKN